MYKKWTFSILFIDKVVYTTMLVYICPNDEE